MTDGGVATIPEGTGYHAFQGPRPIAWGQRSTLMQTGNALEHYVNHCGATVCAPACENLLLYPSRVKLRSRITIRQDRSQKLQTIHWRTNFVHCKMTEVMLQSSSIIGVCFNIVTLLCYSYSPTIKFIDSSLRRGHATRNYTSSG